MNIGPNRRTIQRSIAAAILGTIVAPWIAVVASAGGSMRSLAPSHMLASGTKYGTVNEVTVTKLNQAQHTFVAKGEVISANDEHIKKVTWRVEYGTFTLIDGSKVSKLKNGEKFGEVAGTWIGSTLKATAIDK